MTNEEKIDFEREIFVDIEENLLRRRYFYLLDITKNQREDIESLFKYNKYLTIYVILLNVILIGLMLCLILTN